MTTKRTYPRSAAALRAFFAKHHVTDYRQLEKELGFCKGYFGYQIRGASRFGIEGMTKLCRHFGLKEIDPDLLAAYELDDKEAGVKSRVEHLSVENLLPAIAWLRKLRLEAGLSCIALSKALGREASFIAEIERKQQVMPRVLQFIADYFKVEVPFEVMEAARKETFRRRSSGGIKRAEEDMPPFAVILRMERMNRLLTPEQLSKLIGAGAQYIQQIEGGHKRISPSKLAKLAEVFELDEVPVEWVAALAVTDQMGKEQRLLRTQETLPPIGWVIRSMREERGWDHRKMSQRLDVGIDMTKCMEYGRVAINDDYLCRYAKAFGFSAVPENWWVLRHESRLVPQPPGWQDLRMLTELGRLIRAERREKSISLLVMGQHLELDPTTVGEFEYGRLSLSDERLLEISQVLGYKVIPAHFLEGRRIDEERKAQEKAARRKGE